MPPQVARERTGVLAVESGKYLLQLSREQAAAFGAKVAEIARGAGWAAKADGVEGGVPEAQVLFTRAG